MKPENIYAVSELARSLTPYGFALGGIVVILCAMLNSERLVGDRFISILAGANLLLGSAAGGYSPQSRQPQNRISASQVDIDQSK